MASEINRMSIFGNLAALSILCILRYEKMQQSCHMRKQHRSKSALVSAGSDHDYFGWLSCLDIKICVVAIFAEF